MGSRAGQTAAAPASRHACTSRRRAVRVWHRRLRRGSGFRLAERAPQGRLLAYGLKLTGFQRHGAGIVGEARVGDAVVDDLHHGQHAGRAVGGRFGVGDHRQAPSLAIAVAAVAGQASKAASSDRPMADPVEAGQNRSPQLIVSRYLADRA